MPRGHHKGSQGVTGVQEKINSTRPFYRVMGWETMCFAIPPEGWLPCLSCIQCARIFDRPHVPLSCRQQYWNVFCNAWNMYDELMPCAISLTARTLHVDLTGWIADQSDPPPSTHISSWKRANFGGSVDSKLQEHSKSPLRSTGAWQSLCAPSDSRLTSITKVIS